jgi:O-antigen ligase
MKYLFQFLQSHLFNQLAFASLLLSGAYITLLWSPNILGKYVGFWAKIIIYAFPGFMVCLMYSRQVLTDRKHRPEIILVFAVIILGLLNTALSDAPAQSLKTMRTFLLTGMLTLWASMFLIGDERRRQAFDWFCAGSLAIVTLVEILNWLMGGRYDSRTFQIFILHPIPLGTFIILLSVGPARLIASGKTVALPLLGCLLGLGSALVIYLTHKRGTFVALAIMLAVGVIIRVRRRRYLAVAILLALAVVLPWQAHKQFTRLDPTVPRHNSILSRLELYPFAFHIWKTHPIMGMGLRPLTLNQYLDDYHLRNQALKEFPQAVAKLQTFDNLLLTALIELGSLMTLTYLTLVISIVWRYCRRLRSDPTASPLDWYRVLVLLGFAVHSLSFDSLVFPPINWLFHVQLGLMAGYRVPDSAPGPVNAAGLSLSEAA